MPTRKSIEVSGEVSMASLHLYISRKNPCVDTLFGENHGKTQPSGCSRRCEPPARTKRPAGVWVQGFDSAPRKRPPSQNVSFVGFQIVAGVRKLGFFQFLKSETWIFMEIQFPNRDLMWLLASLN